MDADSESSEISAGHDGHSQHYGQLSLTLESFRQSLPDLIEEALTDPEIEEGIRALRLSPEEIAEAANEQLPEHIEEIWASAESERLQVEHLRSELDARIRALDVKSGDATHVFWSRTWWRFAIIVLCVIIAFAISAAPTALGLGRFVAAIVVALLALWQIAVVVNRLFQLRQDRRGQRRELNVPKLETDLDEASRIHINALSEHGVLPKIRILLNKLQKNYYSLDLAVRSAPGLQADNVQFRVETTGSRNLIQLLGAMPDGGSIGIAGPRGSGKTSVLQAVCLGRLPIRTSGARSRRRQLAVMVTAPVEFSSREFLLHLFATLCDGFVGQFYGYGRGSAAPPTRLGPKRLLLRHAGWLSILSLVAGLVVLYLALPLKTRRLALEKGILPYIFKSFGKNQHAARAWASHAREFINPLDGRLAWLGIMLLLAALLLCLVAIYRALQRAAESASSQQRSRDPLRMLIDRANSHLDRIRFQQSYSSGWSGALKLPLVEGGINEARTLAENQMSLPDIVSSMREFLSDVSALQQVMIAVDELDKISSDMKAWQFLNDLKGIFGVSGCFYLVSISEEALSGFELRGLPFRDVFDTAFDEVAHLRHLEYAESRDLLERRVIGLSAPYICLCHCLAGGLPRDLVRVARDLVTIKMRRERLGDAINLDAITADLIRADIRDRTAATMIAVRARGADLELEDLISWIDKVQILEIAAGDMLNASSTYPASSGPTDFSTDNAPSEVREVWRKVHRIGFGLAGSLYYSATLIELFQDGLTEGDLRRLEDEGQKSVEQLARARQGFSISAIYAWPQISRFRQAWQMETCDFPRKGQG
jgi:hypothetical protein